MALPNVAKGDPHVKAHNDERKLLNDIQKLEDADFKAGLNASIREVLLDSPSIGSDLSGAIPVDLSSIYAANTQFSLGIYNAVTKTRSHDPSKPADSSYYIPVAYDLDPTKTYTVEVEWERNGPNVDSYGYGFLLQSLRADHNLQTSSWFSLSKYGPEEEADGRHRQLTVIGPGLFNWAAALAADEHRFFVEVRPNRTIYGIKIYEGDRTRVGDIQGVAIDSDGTGLDLHGGLSLLGDPAVSMDLGLMGRNVSKSVKSGVNVMTAGKLVDNTVSDYAGTDWSLSPFLKNPPGETFHRVVTPGLYYLQLALVWNGSDQSSRRISATCYMGRRYHSTLLGNYYLSSYTRFETAWMCFVSQPSYFEIELQWVGPGPTDPIVAPNSASWDLTLVAPFKF